MIIFWKRDRLNVVPVLGTPVEGSKNKVAPTISTIILRPGYNEIPDDVWESIQDSLKEKLANGSLEIMAKEVEIDTKEKDKEGNKKKKIVQKGLELKDIEPHKIDTMLKQTNDPELLEKWLKKEAREDVRISIRNRLEELKKLIATKPKSSKKK